MGDEPLLFPTLLPAGQIAVEAMQSRPASLSRHIKEPEAGHPPAVMPWGSCTHGTLITARAMQNIVLMN